ncbi:NAD(P)H-dependent oxidoreductase [Acinetobacter sp. NIPH 2699]|uniref:NAD(P)H-dependent oxidoreductase n=1 Tax=Acinetobacter sp. NIPH 2699 TaxID=2923433 RepID=UPI001F4B86AD|nr:NAD(P)H-dependent oxidoreductase [Acinetobacter sp. NIPH 2699]MCH7337036.1 NAD(P)H-dependent oxidoreductase [Acinetobacter sp. NIPH 2699]
MSILEQKKNALIVITHPDSTSLSHQISNHIANLLIQQGMNVEIADLYQEEFKPAITIPDLGAYRGQQALGADILFEQTRFDRADIVYFVFPVYWWSVPALLKGWFERVFTHGWAYQIDDQGTLVGQLKKIPVKLIGTGTGDQAGYDKHGYSKAIHTQIVEGIFGFCGNQDVQTSILYHADFIQADGLQAFFKEIDTTVLDLNQRSVSC